MSKKRGSFRALKTGFDDILTLVALIAIVVVVNAILHGTSRLRVDLTQDELYTLSQASKDVAKALPGEVQIKAFFSEGLQAPDHNLAQSVDDLLAEYEAASEGKIHYEVIFPKDEDGEEVAEGYGIEKIAVGQQDRNQVGLRLVYKGIALVYGDKQEVIPQVKSDGRVEYELTKALKALVTDDYKKVGVLSSSGGPASNPQFIGSLQNAFQNIYGKLVAVEAVDLSTEAVIPPDLDVLVLLNVQDPVPQPAQFAIDQFLMSGKSLALFQSPSGADPRMPQLPFRQPIPHGLNALFESYGVKLNNDLILDRERNVVGIGLSQRGLVQISYPSLPMLTGINKESIIAKGIDPVVFPFAGSLELTDDVLLSSSVTVTKLIETADSGVARKNVSDLAIEKLMEPTDDEVAGPHLAAVTIQGAMKSAYADGPPEGIAAPEGGLRKVADSGARILVVSNGEFLFPNNGIGYSGEYAQLGGLFFLNAMDWLVQDESLIAIRNKDVPRLLEPVDEDTQTLLQFANIAGVPLGVLLLGMVWFTLRYYRKRRIAASFSA